MNMNTYLEMRIVWGDLKAGCHETVILAEKRVAHVSSAEMKHSTVSG